MTQPQESCVPSVNKQLHSLSDTWTLWCHLPHDTDWSLESYKNILTFNHIEEIISLNHAISEKMVKNCMLFMMKDGIQPIWEDPQNRNGGCFSYRISNTSPFFTALSKSAALARLTFELISPVAGLKTFPILLEEPFITLPSIKCSIEFI